MALYQVPLLTHDAPPSQKIVSLNPSRVHKACSQPLSCHEAATIVPLQPKQEPASPQQNPYPDRIPSQPHIISAQPPYCHDAATIVSLPAKQKVVASPQRHPHLNQSPGVQPHKLSAQPPPPCHDVATIVPLQPKHEPASPQQHPHSHPDRIPSQSHSISAQPPFCHDATTFVTLLPKQQHPHLQPKQHHPHPHLDQAPFHPHQLSRPFLPLDRPLLEPPEFPPNESSLTDDHPFRPISLHSVVTSYVSLGCPVLDRFLKGGLRACHVTEIVGEAATGKTQLCLQLALTVQATLPAPLPGPVQAPQRQLLSFSGAADTSRQAADTSRGSALYIYTDGRFPTKRLFQLANSSQFKDLLGSKSPDPGPVPLSSNGMRRSSVSNGTTGAPGADCKPSIEGSWGDDPSHPCDHVFIKEISTVQELAHCLEGELHLELSRSRILPIRLLIIDSIASLFRSEFDHSRDDMCQRTAMLFRIASALKQLADRYKIAVVVTNQVTASVEPSHSSATPAAAAAAEDGESEPDASGTVAMAYSGPHPDLLSDSGNSQILWSSGQHVIPALGLAWSHCVNTRLLLSRRTPATFLSYSPYQTPRLGQQAQEGSSQWELAQAAGAAAAAWGSTVERKLVVVFSPYLPPGWVDFSLGIHGIVGAGAMAWREGVDGGSGAMVSATSCRSNLVIKPALSGRGREAGFGRHDVGEDMDVGQVESSCRAVVPVGF